MQYDHEKADQLVTCPACQWSGRLEQTHDQDVLDRGFAKVGMVCVCPKCATEVMPSSTDKPGISPPRVEGAGGLAGR